MRLGNVRLLDDKGRVHDSTSKAMITLPLQQDQLVEYKSDGSCVLTAQALWDSSVHDSILLNRVTASNHRVFLQLGWSVAVETCADQVQFSMDTAVTIQTRGARGPSRLFALLGTTKVLPKSSTVFTVRLSPPLTRSAKDLWRLDTAEKYVRGEEALGSWRPRGLSVVEDYTRLVTMERRAADVQAIRVILGATPAKPLPAGAAIWGEEQLLKKSVDLWQKKFGHRGEVRFRLLFGAGCAVSDGCITDRSESGARRLGGVKHALHEQGAECAVHRLSEADLADEARPSKVRHPSPKSSSIRRLISFLLSDGPTKKGHLLVMNDANENVWERRWFVLRR